MDTNKNYTLELLKLFASYMVVFIHVMFYGKLGVIMDTLARFAVPFFFLISGYYSYQIGPEIISKRIRKTFSLFIFSSICYISFNTIASLLTGDTEGIVTYFSQYLDLKTLRNLFVFNMSVSCVHLWYLLAILYVYIVFLFFRVFRFDDKAIFIISFLLLFLHLLLGEGLSVIGISVPVSILRNFALMGLPFFALGLFTKKHENKLYNIPNYVLLIMVAAGISESLVSRYFFGKNELYIGSLFVLFAAVAVFVKYPSIKYPPFLKALSGCSTYVYIFHIMISYLIIKIYNLFGIRLRDSMLLRYIHPIIVCVAATVVAYWVVRLSNLISAKNKSETKNF